MKPRDPLIELKAFVARYPTQQAAAAALEISPPMLVDLLRSRRSFSARVLARLGLERVVVRKAVA